MSIIRKNWPQIFDYSRILEFSVKKRQKDASYIIIKLLHYKIARVENLEREAKGGLEDVKRIAEGQIVWKERFFEG